MAHVPDDESDFTDLSDVMRDLGLQREDVQRVLGEKMRAEAVLASIMTSAPSGTRKAPAGDARRRPQRVVRACLIAAATLAVLALVVPSVLPTTATATTPALLDFKGVKDGVMPTAGADAREELEKLAVRASRQPAQSAQGRVQFVESDGWSSASSEPSGDGGAASVLIPSHVSKYYFPDGTMRSIERRGVPLDDRGFITTKQGGWSAQRPVSDETFDFSDPGPGFAEDLSVDPKRLFRQLVGNPAECQGSRASCLVSPLVNLHSSYVVPMKVVAGTWRLLAQESGVSLISETRDRLGRRAIAFTIRGEDPNFQEVILADPATGAWLGNETVLVGRSSDFDFRDPAVVEFNAVVRSEFVDQSDVPN